MNTALVIKSDILPYSESFIREQVTACTRWGTILIGRHYVQGVALDGMRTKVLPTNRLVAKIASYLDAPYWGHASALHSEHAQLVHVHFGTEAVKFWPVLRKLRLPVVVTLHGSDINIRREWWEKEGGLIGRKYPQRLLKLSTDPRVHFVAVSEAVKQRAMEFGISSDRIQVLHIGVDIRKFCPIAPSSGRQKRRVLFVGRLVEKKGVRYLIEAFRQVCGKIGNCELMIIGDGPLGNELKVLAHGLPVIFAGKMSSPQVRQQINGARVLCLPSITAENGDAEGLPIVILEAQASGVPVVTSALGGAVEGVINGKTGFATPPKNSSAIAEALINILSNDSVANAMAVAAREFIVEKFDLRNCTSALERYYDSVTVSM